MTLSQVLKHYGGTESDLARSLNTSRQVVANWRNNGIPKVWQRLIEHETQRKLKADK